MKCSEIQICEANGKLREADMQIMMTLEAKEVVLIGSLISQETQHKMTIIAINGTGADGSVLNRVSLTIMLGKDGLIRRQFCNTQGTLNSLSKTG